MPLPGLVCVAWDGLSICTAHFHSQAAQEETSRDNSTMYQRDKQRIIPW
jgi:hypothetical protein